MAHSMSGDQKHLRQVLLLLPVILLRPVLPCLVFKPAQGTVISKIEADSILDGDYKQKCKMVCWTNLFFSKPCLDLLDVRLVVVLRPLLHAGKVAD